MDEKITDFPIASDLIGAVVPIVQGATDKQAPIALFTTATLASSKIFVGNGSGIATAVNLSQDGVLSNAGALEVIGLLTKPLPTLSAGLLKYDGSDWVFDSSGYLPLTLTGATTVTNNNNETNSLTIDQHYSSGVLASRFNQSSSGIYSVYTDAGGTASGFYNIPSNISGTTTSTALVRGISGSNQTQFYIASDATGSTGITSSFSGFKGLQYGADYSANYTSRSLIDKGYADAHYGGGGTTTNSLSISSELISGGASSFNGSVAKSIGIQPNSVTNAMLAGSIDLTSKVTGLLPVANGGTGTSSPGLVAGTNVTITGTWPNQTINSSGGAGGYSTIQNQGSSLTQRATFNISTGLTAVDNSGSTRTDITNNLSTGISGGQSVIGGTAASENLMLSSTTHATKGSIIPDSYFNANYTGSTQTDFKLFRMKTFGSGNTNNGGGWLQVNAVGSGYTDGTYNNVTFTYTSGTSAGSIVLTGIVISGGHITGSPPFYWLSSAGGEGDATTIWTASGIPGGSGLTVKRTATDYRSTQGDFYRGITQNSTNGDNQVDAIEYEGYNYTGGGKVNTNEAAFGRNLESHWIQNGNNGQFEWYLQGFYRNGSSNRPFAVYVDKQNGNSNIQLAATAYNFFDNSSNVFFTLNASGRTIISATTPSIEITNTTSGTQTLTIATQSDGSVLYNGTGSIFAPFIFNTPLSIGTGAGAGSSPNDKLRIIGSNFGNMSISAAANKSAAIGFFQGVGDASSGNKAFYMGLDGNTSDNYYGLGGSSNHFKMRSWNGSAFVTIFDIITDGGQVGIATSPTARLHLPAGLSSATYAPLKFTAASALLTTPEAMAVEPSVNGDYLNFTTTTGTIRRVIVAGSSGRATAQTAANTSVATYTLGATDATYEVSANVLVTTSSAENFTVTVTYTDEGNTSRTATMNFQILAGTIGTAINFANGAVPYEGLPLHIRCKASTAITIKTTGTFTGATYNVEGIIKQTN